MSDLPEVQAQFAESFDVPLDYDGTWKTFTFSDGKTPAGRIQAKIHCLWITDQWRDVRTHSQGLNYIVHQNQFTCLFRATDVPENALIFSNAYLDVDGVSYRIDVSILEYGLWQLTLMLLGSD